MNRGTPKRYRPKSTRMVNNDFYARQKQCNAILEVHNHHCHKHRTIIISIIRFVSLNIFLIYFILINILSHEEYVVN